MATRGAVRFVDDFSRIALLCGRIRGDLKIEIMFESFLESNFRIALKAPVCVFHHAKAAG